MLKLCVLPNDPLEAYYKKGEVKERYFNPLDIFGEIHVISLSDSDVSTDKVQTMAGAASMYIHPVGKINALNLDREKDRVLDLVRNIRPDVIRAYNPLIQGWLAAYCKNKLGIPAVVSMHGPYDTDMKQEMLRQRKYLNYLKLSYTIKRTHQYAISNADAVICVFQHLVPIAKKYGARRIELIYNRVDLKRFMQNAEQALKLDKPAVICVGRLSPEKNQECLIQAVKDLDVYLILVGDGPTYERLSELAQRLGIAKRIVFVKSVPHSDIHRYYASADIFALPMTTGGVPIPVMEALASGLPVVIPRLTSMDGPEAVDDVVVFVDNTSDAFRDTFKRILSDPDLSRELKERSQEKMLELDGSVMEGKEAALYKSLLDRSKPLA